MKYIDVGGQVKNTFSKNGEKHLRDNGNTVI